MLVLLVLSAQKVMHRGCNSLLDQPELSRCHVETGELGSDMAAASKKEPSPSIPASPFQTGNKMAMEQPFCLLRDGREKGREGRRRPGGKDEGGEGRASIRQEPKSSAAMPGRVLLPPAGPVQSHSRTEPDGWTQGWFSSPPKLVKPKLPGLMWVTLPSLGQAGTSMPPAGSGPAAAGLCESSRREPGRRAETNAVTSNS
ncbi:unnamed protein product [Coccothraustes coccothraustes]